MSHRIFIAGGAGFSGDRFDAAVPLVAHLENCDGPRYLIFEVLAERTIALAQIAKTKDPEKGYSPYLEDYLRPVLKQIKRHHIKIVSNMGAANPLAAAKHINRLADELSIPPFKIAVLSGDDLSIYLDENTILNAPTMEGNRLSGRDLKAANVYLGGDAVAKALAQDVDIVLVGRTTDSALVLGPLIHEFGWIDNDWDKLASGTICGHLLECGAQVTGAYFADPGFKDVPALAEVGFPIAMAIGLGFFIWKLIMKIINGMETKLDTVDDKVQSQIEAMEERLGTKLDSQHGILVALIDRIRSLDNEIIRQDTLIKTILGVPQLIDSNKIAKADRDDQRKD